MPKGFMQTPAAALFFVAHGIEGEKIRPHVPNAKIYVLQGIGEDSLASFERANLIPVIAGREQLAFWKEHKIKGIKPAIQIETGLNRLGFRENELTEMSPATATCFRWYCRILPAPTNRDIS